MTRPAAIRISVLIRKWKTGKVCLRNLFKTETSKKPMIKLTIRTFASLKRIACRVIDSCSSYLKEKESELNLIRKIIKSARVQQIAITKMMGSFLLFTTDPLGTISLETPMLKI